MRATFEIPRSLALYADALEGVTRVNERLYQEARQAGKPLPSILDRRVGVRYVPEYPGEEDWKHVRRVLADLEGDCEDLSAARAGELRANGERGAKAIVIRTGPNMTHAVVRRANGRIEDPSRSLGMSAPRRPIAPPRAAARRPLMPQLSAARSIAPQLRQLRTPWAARLRATLARPPTPTATYLPGLTTRARPAAINEDVWGDLDEYDEDIDSDDGDPDDEDLMGADLPGAPMELSWTVDRTPTGWKGTIRVPLVNGRALLVSRSMPGPAAGPAGETAKKKAVAKGLSAAAKALDNPMVQALLPPQAKLALSIAKSAPARAVAKKISSWF